MTETTLSRDEIIAGLRQHAETIRSGEPTRLTYDTFMQGFEAINPRFTEINTIVEGSGGTVVNSLKNELEIAFNSSPETIEYMLSLADDPARMDSFIQLLQFTHAGQPEGVNAVISILSGVTGRGPTNLVDGEWRPETQALAPTLDLVRASGLGQLAEGANIALTDTSNTWGETMGLLATVFAPVAGVGAWAARGFAAPAITSGARWLTGLMARNPVTTALVGADVATGGNFLSGAFNLFSGAMEMGAPGMLMLAAGVGVAGYLAYNLVGGALSMATRVAGVALAGVAAVAGFNAIRDTEFGQTITSALGFGSPEVA